MLLYTATQLRLARRRRDEAGAGACDSHTALKFRAARSRRAPAMPLEVRGGCGYIERVRREPVARRHLGSSGRNVQHRRATMCFARSAGRMRYSLVTEFRKDQG